MTYLQEQLFRATHINPQGDIIVNWHSIIDRKVEQDDARSGGLSNTGILLVRDTDKRPFSLAKAVKGILP